MADLLHVGVASLQLAPPLGLDLVGFLRRSRPCTAYGHPLEVGVLVVDDGNARLAICALDLLATPAAFGRRLRAAIGIAAGCDPGAVVINSSHTHSAPPPPGMLKLGGTGFDLRAEEERFADNVVRFASSAATLAARRLAPAVIGRGSTRVDLAVNRRQRDADGSTLVGWNRDAPIDDEVAVIRVDGTDGNPVATLVAYACHPVVVGPQGLAVSSDFVGPLRRRVRGWTGGDCLFLQGCAGNVFPREACFDEAGPEVEFGDALAAAVLDTWHRIDARPRVAREVRFQSSIPIAVWRLEPGPPETAVPLWVESRDVEVQFSPEATGWALEELHAGLRTRLADLERDGAHPDDANGIRIHAEWARRRLVVERATDGSAETTVAAVQALCLGGIPIIALPCEPFCEIGLELKARAEGTRPIVLGYSNDMVGYVPTPEEYRHGGYEVSVAHRHFGRPGPVGSDLSSKLTETGLDLLSIAPTSSGGLLR